MKPDQSSVRNLDEISVVDQFPRRFYLSTSEFHASRLLKEGIVPPNKQYGVWDVAAPWGSKNPVVLEILGVDLRPWRIEFLDVDGNLYDPPSDVLKQASYRRLSPDEYVEPGIP